MSKESILPKASIPEGLLEKRAKVFKALSHPVRLLLLEELRKGKICVCELAELAPQGLPAVSKHLSQMRDAGIIQSSRDGQKVFYELIMPCMLETLGCVDRLLLRQTQESVQFHASLEHHNT